MPRVLFRTSRQSIWGKEKICAKEIDMQIKRKLHKPNGQAKGRGGAMLVVDCVEKKSQAKAEKIRLSARGKL